MTREQRRIRRKHIADAMRVSGATLVEVAARFEVTPRFVYSCCYENAVPTEGHTSKRGRRPVNVFAVLKDLLAGDTMEKCAIKYHVSKARIGQIAMSARGGGWTELREIAAEHRRLTPAKNAAKKRANGRQKQSASD